MKNLHNSSNFNLVGIFRQVLEKKAFIISVILAASIVSFFFCKIQTKKYTSKTIFIVKNPILLDRSFVFTPSNSDKNLFAAPEDVDQVKSIAESDALPLAIIQKFNFQKIYKSVNKEQLIDIVQGNLKFVMKDSKNVELSYTDTDPQRAAAIVNTARKCLEESFSNYFASADKDIIKVLQHNSDSLSLNIAMLNDSIKNMRTRVSNQDRLLPTRNLVISTAYAGNSSSESYLVEGLNDKIILKSKLEDEVEASQNLIRQYNAMVNNQIKIFYVVQPASPANKPSSPKTIIIVLASAIAAMFFSCMLVLLRNSYQRVYISEQKTTKARHLVDM
jgi:LPS O-antigen subunit length determinant protein (WzzB/FepE family)